RELGGPRWITARTSARSIPMPKALVATTTSATPSANSRCPWPRSAGGRPPWWARAPPALGREPLPFLLGGASRGSVDDGGAAPRSRLAQRLGESGVDQAGPRAPAFHLGHPQREIGTREALDELRRIRGQAETLQDLVTHHGRG